MQFVRMKLFTTTQIRNIDRLTIEKEPILSIDLMERAAESIFTWFAKNIQSDICVVIFAGPGNNGGDGLALARMLIEVGYPVEVFTLAADSYSIDFQTNLARLKHQSVIDPIVINDENDFPILDSKTVIVDSLFGTGLTRPLSGLSAKLVQYINSINTTVVSIDIPSGLNGDENPYPNVNPTIHATVTLSLQFPKLSYLLAENNEFVGLLKVLPIGLHPDAIESTATPYMLVDHQFASSLLKPRETFSHKGDYGHCLIIAGSYGMMGASVLSSTACIKAGAGLVTAHVPRLGYSILQQAVPEVMADVDEDDYCFSGIPSTSKYSAIGIGPGLGKDFKTITGLKILLKKIKVPLLVDADGLNILSENTELIAQLPDKTIITPHPKEFDRLFGTSACGFQRLQLAVEKAKQLGIVIVLKGAYTQIVCPDGEIYFNSSGNPGMATGGSGDVLSGIITSLLGQGYDLKSASILGVYLHGLAGDIAANEISCNALTASDIVYYLGDAFKLIENE